MKRFFWSLIIFLCLTCAMATTASASGLPRPRVLTTEKEISEALERIKTDEIVAGWYKTVLTNANKYISGDLINSNMDSSPDVLSEARELKSRVLALSFVYFNTEDETYAQRVCDEVLQACTFDWGYSHTPLGVAEMAFSVALGYDWLYDEFSSEEKLFIENTLIEKAITPYYNAVTNGEWWCQSETNWNIVCNGGILTAILALEDSSSDMLGKAMTIGLENINYMMPLFGPDGAWEEGVMYWRFTTEYFANFMSTLVNTIGDDLGFCDWDGVKETGYFPYYMTGAGGCFSFSDSIQRRENPPQVFWFAKYFGDQGLAGLRLREMEKYKQSGEVRDILWYNGKSREPILEKDKSFDGIEAFSMRDTYENTDGIFLAGKGAKKLGISHSHFDAGSFVLDAMGERFIVDLGSESYNMSKDDRYRLYRNRAEGHNTLVINPSALHDQQLDSTSELISFETDENAGYAVLDLTPAYKDAISMKRGFFFDRIKKSVLLQDDIVLNRESDVWWFVHTPANITLSEDKRSAVLEIKGKQLCANIIGNDALYFEILEAKPFDTTIKVEGQTENSGIRKLAINARDIHNTTIKVSFTPMEEKMGNYIQNIPVECWSLSEGVFITKYIDMIAPGEYFDFDASFMTPNSNVELNNAVWSIEGNPDTVKIDSTTGLLEVSQDATESSFTVLVNSDEGVAKKTVKITPIVFCLESIPLSVLPPSKDTILTIKPQYIIRYKNGIAVENSDIYELVWKLNEDVEGASIDNNTGYITITSDVKAECAEVIAELNGSVVLSQKIYFITKSLASSELGTVAWNSIGFGGKPWLAIDGDMNTYIDTGRHSKNAGAIVWMKLPENTSVFNKVRVTIGNTDNTAKYIISASDSIVGEEPTESAAFGSDIPTLYPALSGGQMVFESSKKPDSLVLNARFPDMTSSFLSFKNNAVGYENIPNFILHEIEVFNSMAGNGEIFVNADNNQLLECKAVLYDTEGDIIAADNKGTWSIDGTPDGISINQHGEITVLPWVEKQEITVRYTYDSDVATVDCEEKISVGFTTSDLFYNDECVDSLKKGTTYQLKIAGGELMFAAMYRIDDGERKLHFVCGENDMISVPNDEAEYEIKLFNWSEALYPYTEVKTYTSY